MRDRDVRNAIVDALRETNAYDDVWINGSRTDGDGATSQLAVAALEPESSTQEDHWDAQGDGALLVTSRVRLTFLYRNEDGQLRDEGVEALLGTAANALNGKSLADLTLPALTRFTAWKWELPNAPQRQITAMFSYAYLVEGWNNYDTAP